VGRIFFCTFGHQAQQLGRETSTRGKEGGGKSSVKSAHDFYLLRCIEKGQTVLERKSYQGQDMKIGVDTTISPKGGQGEEVA